MMYTSLVINYLFTKFALLFHFFGKYLYLPIKHFHQFRKMTITFFNLIFIFPGIKTNKKDTYNWFHQTEIDVRIT